MTEKQGINPNDKPPDIFFPHSLHTEIKYIYQILKAIPILLEFKDLLTYLPKSI
jgi:hypothetical protein